MDPIFDLNKELNDYILSTPFAPFWEVLGYEAMFFYSLFPRSPTSVNYTIKIEIVEGYLSPKAGAPC